MEEHEISMTKSFKVRARDLENKIGINFNIFVNSNVDY